MAVVPLLPPGTIVGGDYVVVRPLNEGGMGAVFVVTQTSTGKSRALKLMHADIAADPVLQRRFEQEARVGAQIASDHVVEVIAAGVDPLLAVPYLVMELLEGEDLRQALSRARVFPPEDVKAIFEQLGHALGAAHAAGVVHRDIKPENIFLAKPRRAGGDRFDVKVLDFGIAKLVAESSTRSTRTAMGSPLWMAPEQTAPGPITPAADVWALGLLAYQLFTGKHFWRAGNDETGTTAQLLREIVLDPIPLASQRAGEQACLESLPAGFDGWFARCAARDPALRYPDANAALKAMRPLFGGAEALAATQLVPSGVHATADETGDATPFIAKLHAEGAVVEPQRASGIRPETPVATVREASSSAPRRRAWAPLVAGALVLAGGGVASGFFLAQGNRRGADGTAVSGGVDSVGAVAPSAGTAAREASQPPLPFESDAAVADAAPAGAPSSHPAQPEASAARAEASRESPATRAKSEPTMGEAPKPPPPRTSPAAGKAPAGVGGFFDPADRQGPTQRRMGDRQVRLFVRLAANDSNVQDAVVRRAIEWNSWQYLHCYERTFGAIKELPEGVVTVAYEILDRLPRHATLVSSTIDSAAFNACVVGTLTGQTINAAGPEGKGRVVHAFRFVPM